MEPETTTDKQPSKITLSVLPPPCKVLATCIIATLAFGMIGALGQIIVHDIIPTFYSDTQSSKDGPHTDAAASQPNTQKERGDLFTDLATAEAEKVKPLYENEQFVWTLRWTHIHIFGMNMIFIFLGVITAMLDAGIKLRAWLIGLPFFGVLIDVLAVWLKAFVSPAFFWLHMPGGGLFALIFLYVSLRALWEMWIKPERRLLQDFR